MVKRRDFQFILLFVIGDYINYTLLDFKSCTFQKFYKLEYPKHTEIYRKLCDASVTEIYDVFKKDIIYYNQLTVKDSDFTDHINNVFTKMWWMYCEFLKIFSVVSDY